MANQFASPNITVKEVDLSGVVPAVDTSTGAFVGDFNWGPVEQPVLVSNEAGLVEAFGSPALSNDSAAIDFLSASYFLKYSGALYVTRAAGSSARNAIHAGTLSSMVKNRSDFEYQESGLLSNEVIAKYPGTAGNSLSLAFCSDSANFATWALTDPAVDLAAEFDGAPGTSSYAATYGGADDEVHVAVIDEDGTFTGTPGAVLEKFPYVSQIKGALTSDGSNNYLVDVINAKSNYVWVTDISELTQLGSAKETTFTSGIANGNLQLANGVESPALTTGNYETGWDTFDDPETITVDLLICPSMVSDADHKTVVDYVTGIAATKRKDCVAFASPSRNAVLNQASASAILTAVTGINYAASSYLITDSNLLKVYDKYSDQYLFIPAASSTAGLCALTDQVAAPWFSPAGQRRGLYFGVTSLAWNADRAARDTLYKAGINPIVNLPGQGILLYGDKTKESRPSAFDRINVRRLFLTIERAIKQASENVLFEFNDEFTRSEFVGIVEPFLREIQGRRGITDFRVVCDETNNTAAVIDSNRFVASIFIKPARSINFVTLNFVAVRTGVEFEEVVGVV